MRHHYTHLLERPKPRTLTTANAGEDVKQQSAHSLSVGGRNAAARLEHGLAASSEMKRTLPMGSSDHAP